MLSSSDSILGIIITLDNPIMVDSDDGGENDGDDLHPNSQESSESLPSLVLNSIWDCPSITHDEMVDDNSKMIKGWRCGYCPIPGGLGAAPLLNTEMQRRLFLTFLQRGRTLSLARALKMFLQMFAMP